MPLRLRSTGGGSVVLNPPDTASDVSMTVPALAGATLLTNKTPGCVLQVVQVVKADTQYGTFGALWAAVSGLSASITPSSATSKILVTVDLKAATPSNSILAARLLRNGTVVNVGDAASTRRRAFAQIYNGAAGNMDLYGTLQVSSNFLDSPASTSTLTYSVEIGGDATTTYYAINRTHGDRDNTYYDARLTSTITLMEIAA
jgi:hypothetical protein